MSNINNLIERLRAMGGDTRHDFDIGDYWNAVDEAADALEAMQADAVPREPTIAMIQAFRDLQPWTTSSYIAVTVWRAMYDAARSK